MDELSPRARALLEAAKRADDPSPAARAQADEAVRAALARHGMRDLPALDAATVRPSGWLARASTGVKLGAGVLAIAAGLFGVRAFLPDSTPPSPAPAPRPMAASEVPLAPPEPAANVYARPELPQAPRRPEAAPARSARPANPATPAARDDRALERELKLLAAADDLIRRARYADALALLERSPPSSLPHAMREERAALRILSLCGVAPRHAVRERAQFLRSSPRSVLAARVRQACGGGDGDPP